MIKRIRGFWLKRRQPKIYNVFLERRQTYDEYLEWKQSRKESLETGGCKMKSGVSMEGQFY